MSIRSSLEKWAAMRQFCFNYFFINLDVHHRSCLPELYFKEISIFYQEVQVPCRRLHHRRFLLRPCWRRHQGQDLPALEVRVLRRRRFRLSCQVLPLLLLRLPHHPFFLFFPLLLSLSASVSHLLPLPGWVLRADRSCFLSNFHFRDFLCSDLSPLLSLPPENDGI